MGYWKAKVVPKINQVFNIGHKKAAADACKAFDASKEEINKEFEEKKEELKPKVLDIYNSSPPEIKTLLKKRTDFKKHSSATNKFLQELVKIDFPGSKQVSEASSKYKPALVWSSIVFIFEKVGTFIPEEPPAAEREVVVEEKKEEGATSTEPRVEEKVEEPKKEEEPLAKPAEVVEEVKAVEPPKLVEDSKKPEEEEEPVKSKETKSVEEEPSKKA